MTATTERQRILDLIERRCALAMQGDDDTFGIAATYLRYLSAEIASGLTAAEIDANSAVDVDYNALLSIPARELGEYLDKGWSITFRQDNGQYVVLADNGSISLVYAWGHGTPEEQIDASFGQLLLRIDDPELRIAPSMP